MKVQHQGYVEAGRVARTVLVCPSVNATAPYVGRQTLEFRHQARYVRIPIIKLVATATNGTTNSDRLRPQLRNCMIVGRQIDCDDGCMIVPRRTFPFL